MDAMINEILCLSVERSYEDILRIFEKYGYNLNLRNGQNFKQPSLTKLFIDNGANVNEFDHDGHVPLHVAAKSGNVKSVQFLLAAGEDINFKNLYRETALHLAIKENHKDVVNLLLHKGAAVNINCDYSALSIASDKKNSVLIKTLLKYNADLHFIDDEDGSTPLHKLVWETDKSLIKLISRRIVDVDCGNTTESTALHLAAERNNPIFVEMLLDRGAQVDLMDEMDETALHEATRSKCCLNNNCVIKILLDRGANPNAKGYFGQTPLLSAAEYLDVSAIKLLLEHGADINAIDADGATIFHYAVKNHRIDVIKFIINTTGIDVNSRCLTTGETAFHRCSTDETLPNRIYLLDRGFNIHAKSARGQTLLSESPAVLEWGNKKLLLEHMAKQQSVGIAVEEFDKDVIAKNKQYQQYFDLCTEELKEMKATIICDNISFHQVLTASNRILSGYAKNSKLTQIFTDSDVEEMFPIYYKTMRIRFDPEIVKQNRIQKAIEFLNDVFKNYDLFNFVSEEVVKYLNDKDLTMLMC